MLTVEVYYIGIFSNLNSSKMSLINFIYLFCVICDLWYVMLCVVFTLNLTKNWSNKKETVFNIHEANLGMIKKNRLQIKINFRSVVAQPISHFNEILLIIVISSVLHSDFHYSLLFCFIKWVYTAIDSE